MSENKTYPDLFLVGTVADREAQIHVAVAPRDARVLRLAVHADRLVFGHAEQLGNARVGAERRVAGLDRLAKDGLGKVTLQVAHVDWRLFHLVALDRTLREPSDVP